MKISLVVFECLGLWLIICQNSLCYRIIFKDQNNQDTQIRKENTIFNELDANLNYKDEDFNDHFLQTSFYASDDSHSVSFFFLDFEWILFSMLISTLIVSVTIAIVYSGISIVNIFLLKFCKTISEKANLERASLMGTRKLLQIKMS